MIPYRLHYVQCMKNFLLIMLFVSQGAFAQNPWTDWVGDISAFEFFDDSIQLAAPPSSGSSTIMHHSEIINDATWKLRLHLAFNPSSNNYFEFWIAADSTLSTGYVLQAGSSDDDLKLWFHGAEETLLLIDGPDDILDASSNTIDIEVQVDASYKWFVHYTTAEGRNALAGPVHQSDLDPDVLAFRCTYTSTRSDKFSITSLDVTGDGYRDQTAPSLLSSEYSHHKLSLHFDEPVTGTINDYPFNLSHDVQYESLSNPGNGAWIEFSLSDIRDSLGNTAPDTVLHYRHFVQVDVKSRDVVINELLIDPDPPELLPPSEYIEIWNISAHPMQLGAWTISDASTMVILPERIVMPDSFVVLVPEKNLHYFDLPVIPIPGWPSLNNSGDSLTLSFNNMPVHQVVYTNSTFDTLYDDGRAIELLDPRQGCPDRWVTAAIEKGGSPGSPNTRLNFNPELNVNILQSGRELVVRSSLDAQFLDQDRSRLLVNQKEVKITMDGVEGRIMLPDSTGLHHVIIDFVTCSGASFLDTLAFQLDFKPPSLINYSQSQIDAFDLAFDEAIQPTDSSTAFYNGMPASLIAQDSILTMVFQNLPDTDSIALMITNISDRFGNVALSQHLAVPYTKPTTRPSMLVINEFHTGDGDRFEFVEIYNRDSVAIDLYRYQLADNSRVEALPPYKLKSGDFVVLTSAESDIQARNLLKLPSWPTLNNDSDNVSLLDPYGQVISSVLYDKRWLDLLYLNKGHSYELIDPEIPCPDKKYWRASHDAGGSPGVRNSVYQQVSDMHAPSLLQSYFQDASSVVLEFDEPISGFAIQTMPALNVDSIKTLGTSVLLFTQPVVEGSVVDIRFEVSDCWGNEAQIASSIVYPLTPTTGDLIINEILFDPESGGEDYIEIYNASGNYVSTRNVLVTNSKDSVLLPQMNLSPGSLTVFTPSREYILNRFPGSNPTSIFHSDIPSMPDDEGLVYLASEAIIDSIAYDARWHHELLKDVEGVALERLSPTSSGFDKDNWHSASTASGYGTPGLANSVSHTVIQGSFTAEPIAFAPGSATQSFTTFSYLDHPTGSTASIHIYDRSGRLIRTLMEGELLGIEGFKTWGGTGSNGRRVSSGYYLAVMTVRHPKQGIKTYNQKVVVAFD